MNTGRGRYSGTISRSGLARSLFSQVCGGWSGGIIAMLLAQRLGGGSNEYIFYLLLAVSSCLGSSWIANDILAAIEATERKRISRGLFLRISLVGGISTCIVPLWDSWGGGGVQRYLLVMVFGIVFAISIFITAKATTLYYKWVMGAKQYSTRWSFVYGLTGSTPFQFVLVGLSIVGAERALLSCLLVVCAVLVPPVLQWLLVSKLYSNKEVGTILVAFEDGRVPGRDITRPVTLLVVALTGMAVMSTGIKVDLAERTTHEYLNIAFYVISAMTTSANTFFKASFLSRGAKKENARRQLVIGIGILAIWVITGAAATIDESRLLHIPFLLVSLGVLSMMSQVLIRNARQDLG